MAYRRKPKVVDWRDQKTPQDRKYPHEALECWDFITSDAEAVGFDPFLIRRKAVDDDSRSLGPPAEELLNYRHACGG